MEHKILSADTSAHASASPSPHLRAHIASTGRRLALLGVVALCAAAGSSSPDVTLIVGSRVQLGPIQGIAANLGYTPVSGSIADLNADGSPDIVLGINGSPPVVYLNNGSATPFQGVTGAFVSPPPGPNSPGISWGAAEVTDINGDGHPDLAIAGFNAPNLIYLNNGTANPFGGVSGYSIGNTADTVAYVPAFGDVNNDGFPDLLIANSNHIPSRLYLTHGAPLTSGTYTEEQVGTDIGYGQDAKIADVNGDGRPDLILTYIVAGVPGTDPSGIAIYLNNGTSDPFASVTPIRLLQGDSVEAVAISDLDADGKPDLVAVASDSTLGLNKLAFFSNTGSGSLPYVDSQLLMPDIHQGGGCVAVSIGDVNQDGHPDLVFGCQPPLQNTTPPPVSPAVGAIYLNNGTATPFENVVPIDIPATTSSDLARGVDVGALVKNGSPDVLVVDQFLATADQPGAAGYDPTSLDPNPVAQDDKGTGAIDTALTVDILANDVASAGRSIDKSSVHVVTNPQHGTVTIDTANGSITYQPDNGYSGADSLQYLVSDDLGAISNRATLALVVQSAPVATDDTATIPANQAAAIDVLANDTSTGTLDSASITIVVAPAHGSTVVSAGKIQYTPASGYSGLDTFQYSVTDNLGTASNMATVSIEITAPPHKGGGGSMRLIDLLALLATVALRAQWVRRRLAIAVCQVRAT